MMIANDHQGPFPGVHDSEDDHVKVLEFVTGLLGQMDHYEDLRLCYDETIDVILNRAYKIITFYG